jgi:hypothetical protein
VNTFLSIAPEKRLDYVHDLQERLRLLREIKSLLDVNARLRAERDKIAALLAKPVRETYRVYS